MKKFIAAALSIGLGTAAAFAQNQTSTEYNKKEFFAGYSENSILDPLRSENFDSREIKAYRGWNVSFTYNFKRFIGVKADMSGYYKNFSFDNFSPPAPVNVKSSIYNFLGGVQIKDNKRSKRFSPFIHALGGISKTDLKIRSSICEMNSCDEKNTGFALALGGGVDLKVRKKFSVRLIQIDYNPAFYNGFRENRFRAGFGIVFH